MTKGVFSSKELFTESYISRLEEMYGVKFKDSSLHQRYYTLATMVREHSAKNWIESNNSVNESKQKQVYYFSMEFLIGRLLTSNIMNLGLRSVIDEAFKDLDMDINEIEHVEMDAGLGNGGLGRLAACFLDSIASLEYPGHGNGIRYRYGFFEQKIIDGYQVEVPDKWLQRGFVWEVRKSNRAVEIPFYGYVHTYVDEDGVTKFKHREAEIVKAVPYDVPVIGANTKTTNALRLWQAEAADVYPAHMSAADYERDLREISEFLYPDDSTDKGKILRIKQQYFFVAAGVKSIVNHHKRNHGSLENFDKKVTIQINDTHPALAVAELMRILIDEEGFGWEEAWEITSNTCAYTNHTILAEALEKWDVRLLKPLLPRVYMIIEEIDRRYRQLLVENYGPGNPNVERLAIIGDGKVRMAHLAIVGSFSVNGVAALHTDILKNIEMKDFNELFPGRYNNKTNGITHRRWCEYSNPELSSILHEQIGKDWITNAYRLEELLPLKDDAEFKNKIYEMKQARKQSLADRIEKEQGIKLDPKSIFDIQVKRLHEYKRQLMNALHIMYLYNRLKSDKEFYDNFHPQSFIFGAKAASGYWFAKKVIKLINTIADKVNNDKDVNEKLKVVFVENYNVTYAELIFPAADISEQISTASKEASGTGNMKFMMNGAMTLGTLDGANVEIAEFVGDENVFIFGMNADEVNELYKTGDYNPWDVYYSDDRVKNVLDQLINGFFETVEFDEFKDIYDNLLHNGDHYFVLKDFDSYIIAQEKANNTYKDRDKWLEMSIINTAKSGHFSSDRTIEEYVDDIWHLEKIKFEEE